MSYHDFNYFILHCFKDLFFFRRSHRVGIKCSYAGSGITEDSNVGTIDVVADVKTERVRCQDLC